MAIEFTCSGCARRLSVPDEFAGKKASCPACQQVLVVPPPPSDGAEETRASSAADRQETSTATPSGGPEGLAPDSSSSAPSAPVPSPPTASAPSAAEAPTSARPSPPPSPPAAPSTVATGKWLLRTPERIIYGPVERDELESWVRQGRVTADCDLRRDDESTWRPADTLFPAIAPWNPHHPPQPASSTPRPAAGTSGGAPATGAAREENLSGSAAASDAPAKTPDRGVLILTLGIVGIFSLCPVFSAMAWVMGTADQQEMRAGRMDARGLRATSWGRLLGMIAAFLWCGVAVLGTIWGLFMAAS